MIPCRTHGWSPHSLQWIAKARVGTAGGLARTAEKKASPMASLSLVLGRQEVVFLPGLASGPVEGQL